jgi:hypothetical protein
VPPFSIAGRDTVLTLPDNAVILSGAYSSDPDGKIVSYRWVEKSGPHRVNLSAAASGDSLYLRALKEGMYVFTLTVTDNEGTSSSDDVAVYIKGSREPADGEPAGNNPHDNADATVWPNPFKNTVHVKMDNPHRGRMDITVYDAAGRPLKSFHSSKNSDHWQENFNLSGLNSGIYFMNFKMSDLFGTARIIKVE